MIIVCNRAIGNFVWNYQQMMAKTKHRASRDGSSILSKDNNHSGYESPDER